MSSSREINMRMCKTTRQSAATVMSRLVSGLAVIALCAAARAVRADDVGVNCEPGWTEEFAGGSVDGLVFTLEVLDTGAGPRLYASGTFGTAGGINTAHIAEWDGVRWAPLGEGIDSSGSHCAHALASFDE